MHVVTDEKSIMSFEEIKKMVEFLVMDVDGTLTDGKIYMSSQGETMKAFNIKDGCGIHDILIPNEIIPIVMTGRSSEIVIKRCKEIGIEKVYQGVSDKVEMLSNSGVAFSKTAYIGDDINDLKCMVKVKSAGGIVGCPYDAVNAIKEVSDYIAPHCGGDGAVRDFIEWIIYNGYCKSV